MQSQLGQFQTEVTTDRNNEYEGMIAELESLLNERQMCYNSEIMTLEAKMSVINHRL